MQLKDHMRSIPDFPKPGILFYDICPLLAHPGAFREAIHQLADLIGPTKPDLLAGVESRGFILAAPLALALNCGFMMVRKKNKLPGARISYSYDLEYGSDTVEIQADAVKPGQRVVVVDDLLATGGTLNAAVALLRQVGAEVPTAAVMVELAFLNGRSRLDVPCHALMSYDE